MTASQIVLKQAECWSLLRKHQVARLAVDVAGRPDIFPINYVVDGNQLVFRSGAGTKLAAAVLGRHVAVEIDGLDATDRSVWSVVVKGTARHISHMEERFAVEDLPLYPWIASDKPNFVSIEPQLVTGRRFHVVDGVEPGRDLRPAAEHRGAHHPGAPRLRPD